MLDHHSPTDSRYPTSLVALRSDLILTRCYHDRKDESVAEFINIVTIALTVLMGFWGFGVLGF